LPPSSALKNNKTRACRPTRLSILQLSPRAPKGRAPSLIPQLARPAHSPDTLCHFRALLHYASDLSILLEEIKPIGEFMKLKSVIMCSVFMMVAFSITAQQKASSAIDLLIKSFAAKDYSAGQINKQDLEKILDAGLHAPSANNRQPWRFIVVQNPTLVSQIVPSSPEGNILILVSAQSGGKADPSLILDCGLTVQNIYLAAQALGYGSRIYTGPVEKINSTLRKELEIPTANSVVAVIRVGKLAPGVDAVSGASSRKNIGDITTYK
jgi:nitroreductase